MVQNVLILFLQKEPWFGTEFSVEKVEQEHVDKWLSKTKDFHFHLPSPNQFIPADFSLVDNKMSNSDLETKPYLLVDEPLLKAWFKTDQKFNLPKGFARYILTNPVYTTTPEDHVFLDLLIEVLEYNLSEVMFDATAASFYYSISISSSYGLQIKVCIFIIILCTMTDNWPKLFQICIVLK